MSELCQIRQKESNFGSDLVISHPIQNVEKHEQYAARKGKGKMSEEQLTKLAEELDGLNAQNVNHILRKSVVVSI